MLTGFSKLYFPPKNSNMYFYFKNVDPKSLHFLCLAICLSQLGHYPQHIFPTSALCKNWHRHHLQRPQITFFKTFIAVSALGGNASENEVYSSILLYLYCAYLMSLITTAHQYFTICTNEPIYHGPLSWLRRLLRLNSVAVNNHWILCMTFSCDW